MTEPAKRIRIMVDGVRLEAELKGTKTAAAVYAARKGMTVREVERWLAPNLGYEPE
mgnify:CR=1 FL=1